MSDDVVELRDTSPGDTVAVRWPDDASPYAETDQVVRVFTACGVDVVGKSKVARSLFVELIDQETMTRARVLLDRRYNTFVLPGSTVVLDVVKRSPYGRGEDEVRAARGDASDPLLSARRVTT